jgi:hypothetical protein
MLHHTARCVQRTRPAQLTTRYTSHITRPRLGAGAPAASLSNAPDSSPAPVALLPAAALSAGTVAATLGVVALRGATEAACLQALTVSQLGAALLFLPYFVAALQPRDQASLLARAAAFCRAGRSAFLYACAAAAFSAQLGCSAWLAAAFPQHIASELVPLHIVGFLALAILAGSEKGRPQKSRLRMEIEPGEGERHAVMAQVGARVLQAPGRWAVACCRRRRIWRPVAASRQRPAAVALAWRSGAPAGAVLSRLPSAPTHPQGARLALRNYLWAFFGGCALAGLAQGAAGLAPASGGLAAAYLAAGWAKFAGEE